MTRDLTDLSEDKKINRNQKKFRKDIRSGRVEKTFQVVSEKEVVSRDGKAETKSSSPDITLRDLENISKKTKRNKNGGADGTSGDRESRISVTSSEEITEEKPDITVKSPDGNKNKKEKTAAKKEASRVTDIRAARQREKNKKRIKNLIILVIVAVFALAVYLLRDKWVPKLEGILDRPHATIINDGKKKKGNFPISFDEGAVSSVSRIDNFLVCLDKNRLRIYDENGGESNSFNHNYADPVLKTAKKRMLVYDRGGNSFTVVNRKNEIYSKTVDDRILMAEISDSSSVALVTQDEKYAGVLTVYDPNGTAVYSWSSSSGILSVTFSKDGGGCFITTFNSKDGSLQSVVRYMRFDSTEEIMKSQPLDMLALKALENDNGDFWVVGDVGFCKLDGDGNVIFEYEYSSRLVDFDLTEGCGAVILEGIKRKSAELIIFDSNSDKDEPDSRIYTDDGTPKSLSIENGKIILLKDKIMEAYDFSGNLLATAEVSPEYFDFVFFNENVYFLDYREINKIAFST